MISVPQLSLAERCSGAGVNSMRPAKMFVIAGEKFSAKSIRDCDDQIIVNEVRSKRIILSGSDVPGFRFVFAPGIVECRFSPTLVLAAGHRLADDAKHL